MPHIPICQYKYPCFNLHESQSFVGRIEISLFLGLCSKADIDCMFFINNWRNG